VESAIDESTRQITAVAQVNDPYSRRDDGAPPLRIGQFLEAEIEGETLTEVFVIPRRAVRAGNEILLITPENKLKRVTVEPILGDTETIVISAAARGGRRALSHPDPVRRGGSRGPSAHRRSHGNDRRPRFLRSRLRGAWRGG
jgi:multidrug efflux pump subunit AcrA (membrane-fusion protein)